MFRMFSIYFTCLVLSCGIAAAYDYTILPLETLPQVIKEDTLCERVRDAKILLLKENIQYARYIIVDHASRDVGKIEYSTTSDGRRTLVINIDGNYGDYLFDPDWEKCANTWDLFVAKYWPQVKRDYTTLNAVSQYNRTLGTFSVSYSNRIKGLDVFRLYLDIRLLDGKIAGITACDDRGVFIGKQIPEELTRAQVTSYCNKFFRDNQIVGVKSFEQKNVTRSFSFDAHRLKIYSIATLVADVNGNTTGFKFSIDEQTGTITKLGRPYSPLSVTPIIKKPVLRVYDSTVRFANNGDLLFSSSRPTAGRPWWSFGDTIDSICIYKHNALQLLRPLKILNGNVDFFNYSNFSQAENSMMVITTQSGQILLLNSDGIIRLPYWIRQYNYNSDILDQDIDDTHTTSYYRVSQIEWLHPPDSLLACGLDRANHSSDLYTVSIVNKGTDVRMMAYNITNTLDQDEGLFSYDPIAYYLAYMRIKQEKVSLVFAQFNPDRHALTELGVLPMHGEVTGLARDLVGKRWLVIVGGKIGWVADMSGQTPFIPMSLNLTYDTSKLTPKTCVISPKDGKVIISAILDPPIIFEKENLVCMETLFYWDGIVAELKPVLPLNATNLPRYTFPNGNWWATVKGDKKLQKLDGLVE